MRICDFMHAASISIDIIVTDSINGNSHKGVISYVDIVDGYHSILSTNKPTNDKELTAHAADKLRTS